MVPSFDVWGKTSWCLAREGGRTPKEREANRRSIALVYLTNIIKLINKTKKVY